MMGTPSCRKEEIEWNVKKGLLHVKEDSTGLVRGKQQVERAMAVSCLKSAGDFHPVGVLLGDGDSVLCGQQIYSAHKLDLKLLAHTPTGRTRHVL